MGSLVNLSREKREILAKAVEKGASSVDIQGKPSEILDTLFDKQLSFIRNPSKKKALVCSRRAGKTHMGAVKLILSALSTPGSLSGLIVPIRMVAKLVVWPELKRINAAFNLNLEFRETDLTVLFPNNSKILLAGADDIGQVDKFRGPKYSFIWLDEGGTWGHYVKELIEEVIEPALMDLQGELWFTGTPNAACVGMFHDITNSRSIKGWFVGNRWTLLDNPHLPHAQLWLAEKINANGWTDTNPVYLREYCGLWVRSEDSLIYRFNPERNLIDFLSRGTQWSFLLGVDLGYTSESAFVVIAYSEDRPEVFVVDEYEQKGMSISDLAEKIRFYDQKYSLSDTIVDPGGLGVTIIDEMINRHGLNIRYAEKTKKNDYIEAMNDDFLTGRLRVLSSCKSIIDEWQLLQWDEQRKKPQSGYKNHLSDAALYAWREAMHYAYRAPETIPEIYSPEYKAYQENKILTELETNYQHSQERNLW